MGDIVSDTRSERRKNILLILLSITFLPLDTFVVLVAFLYSSITRSTVNADREAKRRDLDFSPRRVLVTGVGMSKGLTIARLFYEAGHDVVGADFEPGGALACGRFSKSLKKFYRLQAPNSKQGPGPYIDSLLRIVRDEQIDLWISCSGVASAIEDGQVKEIVEARTSCKAIQFDTATTQMLHEKHSFIQHTKEIGLSVPDTHYVTDHDKVEAILSKAPKDRKYIMKPVGMDDANRGDLTLLPMATPQETSAHLGRLPISKESSWILQQFIKGPEYCTHSVVVNGNVKAFTACPSAELLMHYVALPTDSKLYQATLEFTKHYASKGGQSFTGHLSFDFMIDDSQLDGMHSVRPGEDPVLYPIECNPRAHTAVVLFNSTPRMADAYLSLLEPESKSKSESHLVEPLKEQKYYWIGHDLVELLLVPLFSILTMQPGASASTLPGQILTFVEHLLHWREGTFEAWDPLPWWWLYHGYWPMRLWQCLQQRKSWSRINVSTTKMFMC